MSDSSRDIDRDAGDLKTCPMCAEEVKAAALICRYCGHRFDQPKKSAPLRPKPAGQPPVAVTQNIRPGEELFVWSPCLLNGAAGTVAITTDRVFYLSTMETTPVFQHKLNADRKVTFGTSPTRPANCRPDGTVVIHFEHQRFDFHGLNPEVAKEIGATVVPALIDQLFEGDPDMQQRLRERQQTIAERLPALALKASATVKGCKYLGGMSGLRGPRNVTLVFEPAKIIVRELGKPIFTISKPRRGGVTIQGAEQLQQRLSATRLATLGVFALAAPKRTRTAISYITLAVAGGENGIFEVKDTDPMRLQARLSPWLAEH